MDDLNIYEQYFEAEGTFNGVPRHGAKVMIIASKEDNVLKYDAAVTFFPHNEADDFGVSYDAYFSKTIYKTEGRRSKKKEETLMIPFKNALGEICREQKAKVFWDKPLTQPRRA